MSDTIRVKLKINKYDKDHPLDLRDINNYNSINNYVSVFLNSDFIRLHNIGFFNIEEQSLDITNDVIGKRLYENIKQHNIDIVPILEQDEFTGKLGISSFDLVLKNNIFL